MRGEICRAATSGMSERKIAEKYGVPKSTVHDTIQASQAGRVDGKSKAGRGTKSSIYDKTVTYFL